MSRASRSERVRRRGLGPASHHAWLAYTVDPVIGYREAVDDDPALGRITRCPAEPGSYAAPPGGRLQPSSTTRCSRSGRNRSRRRSRSTEGWRPMGSRKSATRCFTCPGGWTVNGAGTRTASYALRNGNPMTTEEFNIEHVEAAGIELSRSNNGRRGNCPTCGEQRAFVILTGVTSTSAPGSSAGPAMTATRSSRRSIFTWPDIYGEEAPAGSAAEIRSAIFDGAQRLGADIPEVEELPGSCGLLYRGQAMNLFAERGAGKTVVATILAASVAATGGRVLYLDRENGPELLAPPRRGRGRDPQLSGPPREGKARRVPLADAWPGLGPGAVRQGIRGL